MGKIEYDDVFEQAIKNSKQEQERIETAKRKKKKIKQIISVILLLLVILIAYFLLPISRIKSIVINGNQYYSDEKILDIIGIDYNYPAMLVSKSTCQRKALANPLIESFEIEVDNSRNVLINITNKKAIGYYSKNNHLYLLLSDGKSVVLESDMYDNLLSLPLICDGFSENMLSSLAYEMGKLDPSIISQISEIWRYKTSYDQKMYRFLMNDGNQTFLSVDSIYVMANYFGIVSLNPKGKKCLILDSEKYSYSIACTEIEKNYNEYLKRIELLKIIKDSLNQDIFDIIIKIGG